MVLYDLNKGSENRESKIKIHSLVSWKQLLIFIFISSPRSFPLPVTDEEKHQQKRQLMRSNDYVNSDKFSVFFRRRRTEMKSFVLKIVENCPSRVFKIFMFLFSFTSDEMKVDWQVSAAWPFNLSARVNLRLKWPVLWFYVIHKKGKLLSKVPFLMNDSSSRSQVVIEQCLSTIFHHAPIAITQILSLFFLPLLCFL